MSNWFRVYGFADVQDKLLVGAYPLDQSDVDMLQWMRIERVLNLVEDEEYEPGQREEVEDALFEAGIEEHRLSLTDYGRLPAPELEQAVGQVIEWLEQEHRVYLHCRAGWQRSAAVAAGVVALREGVGIEEALEIVRQRKPSAEPLPQQREDLVQWWAERDDARTAGDAEDDAARVNDASGDYAREGEGEGEGEGDAPRPDDARGDDVDVGIDELAATAEAPEPAATAEPSEAAEPAATTEPSEPGATTEPSEAAQPAATTEPTAPSEPDEPTATAEFGEATATTAPSEPDEPAATTEPSEATEPSEPDEPPATAEPAMIDEADDIDDILAWLDELDPARRGQRADGEKS